MDENKEDMLNILANVANEPENNKQPPRLKRMRNRVSPHQLEMIKQMIAHGITKPREIQKRLIFPIEMIEEIIKRLKSPVQDPNPPRKRVKFTHETIDSIADLPRTNTVHKDVLKEADKKQDERLSMNSSSGLRIMTVYTLSDFKHKH